MTIIAFSDLHAPGALDPQAWACVLDAISQVQPQGVMSLGDIGDFSAFSGFTRTKPDELDERIASAEDEAQGLRRELAKVRKIHSGWWKYLSGNHEERVLKWILRNAPPLEGHVTVERLIDLDALDIQWVPDHVKATTVAPNLSAIHGHNLFRGKFGGPKYHGAKALELAGTSVIYGHTHKTQLYTRETWDRGVMAAYGLGCVRTLHPAYTGSEQGAAGYDHGFAIIDISPFSKKAWVSQVRIFNGEAFCNGARFSGKRK